MYKNIANAMSPKRSVHHMSELVYDVDFTAYGDAPIESHDEMSVHNKLEKADNDIFE